MLLKNYIEFLQTKPQDTYVEVSLFSDSHSNKVQVNACFTCQQEPDELPATKKED